MSYTSNAAGGLSMCAVFAAFLERVILPGLYGLLRTEERNIMSERSVLVLKSAIPYENRETVSDNSMSNKRMPTSTRVLIVEEHLLMAQGLRKLLESDFEHVEILENGRDLFTTAAGFKPDVILLDSGLARGNGIELDVYFQKLAIISKVIIVAGHAEPAYVAKALRAGVSGCVLKRCTFSELTL